MGNFKTAALLTAGLMLAPACAGELDLGGHEDPVVEAEALPSDECRQLTDQQASSEHKEGTLFVQTLAEIEAANKAAINDDLEEATNLYQTLAESLSNQVATGTALEASPRQYTQEEAERIGRRVFKFLADPEGAQIATKALCAAYAGNVVLAEELLGSITNTQTRLAYEADIEYWQIKEAEKMVIAEAYEEVEEIVELIDEDQDGVRDYLEFWILLNAEAKARRGFKEEALALLEHIDFAGPINKETARLKIEAAYSQSGN